MNGISSKAANTLQNNKKYNGIEFDEDLGLNVCEAFYRHLDPQTGRWWEIDPKIDAGYENISPYNSMFNDPVRYNDFMGDEPGEGDGGSLNTAKFVFNFFLELSSRKLISDINKAENFVFGTSLTTDQRIDLMNKNLKALPNAILTDFSQNPFGSITAGVGGPILRAELAVTEQAVVKTEQAVVKYEVNTADNLLKRSSSNDLLDVHHTPQSQPAKQLIPNYDKKIAPAIVLPQAEHKAIPTLRGTNTAGSARKQLAKDIFDLRKFTNAPNSGLQQLIELFKKTFPEAYKKPKT